MRHWIAGGERAARHVMRERGIVGAVAWAGGGLSLALAATGSAGLVMWRGCGVACAWGLGAVKATRLG
jgi:hypothetical protein